MKTVIYTETVERRIVLPDDLFTDEMGNEIVNDEIVKGLRDGTIQYVPDTEDRSVGKLRKDCGEFNWSLSTSGDYPVVQKRDNFHIEVEWPKPGFLAWYWKKSSLICMISLLLMFAGAVAGVVTSIYYFIFSALFFALNAAIHTFIGTKRYNMGGNYE